MLDRVGSSGAPLPGYKGGRVFENREGQLPQVPGVTYREWDVNPYFLEHAWYLDEMPTELPPIELVSFRRPLLAT